MTLPKKEGEITQNASLPTWMRLFTFYLGNIRTENTTERENKNRIIPNWDKGLVLSQHFLSFLNLFIRRGYIMEKFKNIHWINDYFQRNEFMDIYISPLRLPTYYRTNLEVMLTILMCGSFSQGAAPFLVCATSGTTVLGAFDPLEEIADVCERHGLWLHVDVSSSVCTYLCNFLVFLQLWWEGFLWNPQLFFYLNVYF